MSKKNSSKKKSSKLRLVGSGLEGLRKRMEPRAKRGRKSVRGSVKKYVPKRKSRTRKRRRRKRK